MCYCPAERCSTLESLVKNGTDSWACMGDFNEVMNQSEKSGGREVTEKNNFLATKFLEEVHGLDIGFSGNSFTLCNRRSGLANIREILDRVMASTEWRTLFGNEGVLHLNAFQLDHAPILLNLFLDHPNFPKPFRFQEMWIRDPTYNDVFKGAWECNLNLSGRISIGRRILNTSKTLKRWNK